MANWYYYDYNGKKIGPVPGDVLKQLAQSGVVQPTTPVESDKGQRGTAGQIDGVFVQYNPVANWYYYDSNGNKVGPVSGDVLRQLSESGVVQPTTPVESDNGQKETVGRICGLFAPIVSGKQSRRSMDDQINKIWKWRNAYILCFLVVSVINLVGMLLVANGNGDEATIFLIVLPVLIFVLILMIPYAITWYFFIKTMWEAIPVQFATVTPRKAAWLSFIPIFSYFWIFIAIAGLPTCISKITGRQTATQGISIAVCIWWVIASLLNFFGSTGVILCVILIDMIIRPIFFMMLYGDIRQMREIQNTQTFEL